MDAVFKAIADPTRRQLLDRLFDQDGQPLGALCEGLGISRQATSKHLRVLEEADLVAIRWSGRVKLHYLNVMPIRALHDRWIDKYRAPWVDMLAGLKDTLEGPPMETPRRLWRERQRRRPTHCGCSRTRRTRVSGRQCRGTRLPFPTV